MTSAISEQPRKFLVYNPFTAKKERVMKRFVWATALVISILGPGRIVTVSGSEIKAIITA